MDYLNKIINFFKVEEISEDALKIERSGFEAVILIVNDKFLTKFGRYDSYEKLYRTLLKKYNEYVSNEVMKKLKDLCPDCEVLYRGGVIKIKYYDSYININKNIVKTFIRKEHYEKLLGIQNKIYELGLLYA